MQENDTIIINDVNVISSEVRFAGRPKTMQSPVELGSGLPSGSQSQTDVTAHAPASTVDARSLRAPASLELRGLARSFGKHVALHGLDLSVGDGEFVSILGPSGSGKTTTLNLIAGFDHPTRGAVLIGGRDITWKPSYDRDIGMVFQNYALFPHLSIFENVAFPLRSRGWPRHRIADEVNNALQLVQLGHFAERYPRQLSGGQQQRVALARAVVYRPKLLLMDEPLGALDRKLRAEMQVEIKRIHRDLGSTFIYVTHDQEEALSMSDRIAILNEGRLEQLGEPSVIYDRPASSFVSAFVGDVTFLDALFDRASGTLSGRFIGKVELPENRRPTFNGKARVAVRPEHISLSKAGSSSGDGWRVQEVLFLGDAMSAFVRREDKTLKCKIYTHHDFLPRPGELVDISIDWNRVSIFPKDSE